MNTEIERNNRGSYDLAEEITGLKRGTLYSLVNHREIPHRRVGPRLVVFDRSELEMWMNNKSVSLTEGGHRERK